MSYVINYNLGQDIVKKYLAHKVPDKNPQQLWHAFTELLIAPKTASMMQ